MRDIPFTYHVKNRRNKFAENYSYLEKKLKPLRALKDS